MTDRVVETIESPDGQERVIIVRRSGGAWSFRRQWREDENDRGSGVPVWPAGFIEEAGWGPPGFYAGIYDGMETAKWEALCRVDWLASAQRPN